MRGTEARLAGTDGPAPPPDEQGRAARHGLKRVVYDEAALSARVGELGRDIAHHYRGVETPLVLGLLKGSFIFLADLVRTIRIPLQVDFLIASSYGAAREPSGEVNLLYDPGVPLRDRDVILVEDIVDGGATLDLIVSMLRKRGPRSLELCVLLHKRRVILEKEPRWVGFEAPREFLVGYGLDHAENFRHLPFIGSL